MASPKLNKVLQKVSQPFHRDSHASSSNGTSGESPSSSTMNTRAEATSSSSTSSSPLRGRLSLEQSAPSTQGTNETRDENELVGGHQVSAAIRAAHRRSQSNTQNASGADAPRIEDATTGSNASRLSGGLKKDVGIEQGLNEMALREKSSRAQEGKGLDRGSVLPSEISKNAEHVHTTLQPVLHHRKHFHETEYVTQVREHHIHKHHVQHHLQPLIDESNLVEQHYHQSLPIKERFERLSNTPEDEEFWALLNKQRHTETEICHDRIVVKNGEQVHETIHYHVHNIIQPVIYRDRPIPATCIKPRSSATGITA